MGRAKPIAKIERPNPVRLAVKAAGGPTKAALACLVSGAAVYQWIKLGHVPRTIHAVRLAAASGVSTRELAGLGE